MGDTVATNAECVAVTRLDGTSNRHLADLVHIGTGVTDRRYRRAVRRCNRRLQGCPRINGAENDRRSTLAFGPDHGTHIRVGTDGTHQAGADGCSRITRLSRVTHRMCIGAIRDAEAVFLALRNAGQVNPVNLVQAGHRIVQDVNRHRRIIETARIVKRFSRSEEGVGRTIDAKALTINTVTRAVLAAGFWLGSLWVPLIDDPEMPTLSVDLLASGLLKWAAVWFSAAAVLGAGLLLQRRAAAQALLAMQGCLLGFHLTALVPIAELADRLRQQPVRDAASLMLSQQRRGEPMVMVGAMKPSLHFYTGQVILYEGQSDGALVNIADRLAHEQRRGWSGYPLGNPGASSTVLVLIDRGTAARDHWSDLQPVLLGQIGIYDVWRLDRSRLEQRAENLKADGVDADWEEPRPERY